MSHGQALYPNKLQRISLDIVRAAIMLLHELDVSRDDVDSIADEIYRRVCPGCDRVIDGELTVWGHAAWHRDCLIEFQDEWGVK